MWEAVDREDIHAQETHTIMTYGAVPDQKCHIAIK